MAEDSIDPHRHRLDLLESAILAGPGVVPRDTRTAAADNDGVPDPYTTYVDTIHRHAYRITDATVAGLGEAGVDDDAIFEVSVAAAYGAARSRLDAGLAALRSAGQERR
jgi:hypothetical protein